MFFRYISNMSLFTTLELYGSGRILITATNVTNDGWVRPLPKVAEIFEKMHGCVTDHICWLAYVILYLSIYIYVCVFIFIIINIIIIIIFIMYIYLSLSLSDSLRLSQTLSLSLSLPTIFPLYYIQMKFSFLRLKSLCYDSKPWMLASIESMNDCKAWEQRPLVSHQGEKWAGSSISFILRHTHAWPLETVHE